MMLPMATWRELNILYPVLTVRSPDGNTEETLSRREAYKRLDLGWTLVSGVAFDYMPNPPGSSDPAELPVGDANDSGDVLQVNSGGTGYELIDDLVFSDSVAGDIQGYYARLTNFYFTGGAATETEISSEGINTWTDPNFTMEPSLGLFDYRPTAMKEALADPFDVATGKFSLEGLTLKSNVVFRASLSFEPDEDGGQLDARLLFNRHSGTTPSSDFPIEDVALTMTQGADVDYPGEPSLTFFVGDTIDTNGAGDAGLCKFQVRSTVPGTLRMRALTWYISK